MIIQIGNNFWGEIMIDYIKFENYKAFQKEQRLDFFPITILIGKNSAGKSAISRLPLLISNSLRHVNTSHNPLQPKFDGIDLGHEFKDLVFNKFETRTLRFEIGINSNSEFPQTIKWGVVNFPDLDKQFVTEFDLNNKLGSISLRLKIDAPEAEKYDCELNGSKYPNEQFRFGGLRLLGYFGMNFGLNDKYDSFIQDCRQIFTALSFNETYIEPFRAFPKRLYEFSNDKISGFDSKGEVVPLYLYSSKELLFEVSKWYSKNFNIHQLEIKKIASGKYFELNVRPSDKLGLVVSLMDVGHGISQSLPIVTRALMVRSSLDIVEQPELHLHPSAHSDLGTLFIESALANPNTSFLIETHSENLILRIRRHIAEGKIAKEKVGIYWVEQDEEGESSTIRRINIGDHGEVSDWPEGVFSEDFEEVKAIRQASRNK